MLNAIERRSRECDISVFGVEESKDEDIRKVLAKDVL